MALWHDPLDELIAGLERALHAETEGQIAPFEVFCYVTDVLLYGTPEEWEACQRSPEGRRVAADFERIARHAKAPPTE